MENIMNVRVYKDGLDTIVVFKNTTPDVNKIISSILSTQTTETAVEHLEPLPQEEEVLPKFLSNQENNQPEPKSPEPVSEPVKTPDDFILNIGKMAGKTIKEVFQSNKNWLEYVAGKEYKPGSSRWKEVEAIRNYLSTH